MSNDTTNNNSSDEQMIMSNTEELLESDGTGGSCANTAQSGSGFMNSMLGSCSCFGGFSGVFTNPEWKKLSKNWFPFLLLGIALMVLGFLAIGSSLFATVITVSLIGVLLMVGGVMQTVNSFYTGQWSGFLLHLGLGVLYFVVGLMLLDAPMLNAITLTFLISVFFIIAGLFRIIGSLSTHYPGWGWSLLSGSITFLLGILIFKSWPSSGLWVIGLFVGIEMVFSGWYWIMFSTDLHLYLESQKKSSQPSAV
ncbi:MAG: HdeD family acid-resistance protein [Planctomycetia bacterium]|nr:HdeD family acid-resistance protein [Planctomycetia bacterium]